MANNSDFGSRLIEAFGTDDKEFIAKILGFASKQSVYKIISGEREMDFERLIKFRDYTKHSIDWLLTGEGPRTIEQLGFDLDYSVTRNNENWEAVLEEWYDYEGRVMPDFGGVAFMGGWASFTREQKLAAVSDLKLLLDKTREGAKPQEPGRVVARIEPGERPERNRDIEYLRVEEDPPAGKARRGKR